MIYIWSNKSRATDMLATFFEDGSNLPDVGDRRLRHSIPLPADPRNNGPDLTRILKAIEADRFVRLGRRPSQN
jgi:hypothetical protein